MPRLIIDSHPVISYDYNTSREKYWTRLSLFVISKYGKKTFKEHSKVETILLDAFQFLLNDFKKILSTEENYSFYTYIFWLHEQSIMLYVKTLSGFKLKEIDENEFARYRRILKLVLEQGCDIDFEWGKFPNSIELEKMDEKIQDLLYLGTWIYTFADYIAFQKMIEECHYIDFNEQEYIKVDWQHHYGFVYNELFPTLKTDYEKATFDENSVDELKTKINECFNISYDFAGGIIFEIKKHHNKKDPSLQTIEPYILPKNLSNQFEISEYDANLFYNGLTITRENKLSIENVILKPYSTQRYMFRPILVYNIGGVERALVGSEKFIESIMVLSTNALHWNAMLSEWLEIPCIAQFVIKKGNEHDKILKDKIEQIIKENKHLYSRNVKSIIQKGDNIKINNEIAGEIDFIIVNQKEKIIFVTEVKYNRARYEAVGYRNDYSNFTKTYEKKLTKKVNWIKDNLKVLTEHFSILYTISDLNLFDYKVEGVFFINTPTFYMFNGIYKGITLKQVSEYINDKYEYPEFIIDNENSVSIINHPYFKKPIEIKA